MKNIHLLPTDKPSRLFKDDFGKLIYSINMDQEQNHFEPQHLFITNDEEIKAGDWYYLPRTNLVYECTEDPTELNLERSLGVRKIILTTDQDLDGVQPIDDEFLEWFVKNPSCEWVEVGYGWIRLTETDNEGYWISIPDKQFEMQQEEPKQETLEEAAKTFATRFTSRSTPNWESFKLGFIEGAKWQKERMYSEEEVRKMLFDLGDVLFNNCQNGIKEGEPEEYFDVIIEQFKKK